MTRGASADRCRDGQGHNEFKDQEIAPKVQNLFEQTPARRSPCEESHAALLIAPPIGQR